MEDIIILHENKVKQWLSPVGYRLHGSILWGAIPFDSIARGRSHLSAFCCLRNFGGAYLSASRNRRSMRKSVTKSYA